MKDTKQSEKLLRAIGDADDRFITEAGLCEEDTASETGNVRKGNFSMKKMLNWGLALAACLAIVLVGNNVINSQPNVGDTGTVPGESTSAAGSDDSQYINPRQEVSSMAEAAELTGFDIEFSETDSEYSNMDITVIDGEMIEVNFSNADGSKTGYSVRKARGSDDISGDYNVYDETDVITVGSSTRVTVKGDGNGISLATWCKGYYTYALYAGDTPLSTSEVEQLVSSVDAGDM